MKKKVFIAIFIIVIVGGVTLFFSLINKNSEKTGDNNKVNEDNIKEENTIHQDGVRLKLTVNGNNLYVRLNDSQASNNLLEMLPLTLEFEDFNNTEKIAYLPSELNVDGAPSGYVPERGDFAYYVPWGNLSIFYNDFRYSDSLVKLGEIESGIDDLENIDGSFEMTIERVE